jgi:hypothetical protein
MTLAQRTAGRARKWARGGLCLAVAIGLMSTGEVNLARASSETAVESGGPPTFRRLNEAQYKRSIAQIFGSDIVVPGRFEPPVREDGLLAIGSSHVIMTPSGFGQNALRAREIAAQVLDEKRRGRFLPCAVGPQASLEAACARGFFETYGRQLYRRPLSTTEMAATLQLVRRVAASSGSAAKGIEAGLASLLASPSFTFRMERSQPDPDRPGKQRLDAWSLASRISFLLWDAPPDAELLDAAASGRLLTQPGLEAQVDRMMASSKLEDGLRAFFSDMLAYDQFDGLSKDPLIFPMFNPRLRDDAKEQSLRTIVDHLLRRNADYRDIFTTRDTYLSRSLGALYGVPVIAEGDSGWMRYAFPNSSPHAGLLTFPAFLMLDPSHEGRSSPTIRGKVVRENFLCETVPPPPANVDFRIVQDVNDPVHKTARERLAAHNESPACAGCHKITDPIGLALENYNSVGAYRTKENGVTIDASGEFEGKVFANGLELSRLIRDSESAPSCVVQRTLEYGVGRKLTASEEAWFEALRTRFAADGYRYPALLRQVATSPVFRSVSNPAKLATR